MNSDATLSRGSSPSTVSLLRRERGRSMSWSTFIKAHWGAIAATDLFTVEVVNPFGLVRYHVLFVIDIATRCVCIGGITSDPNGEWMKQVARNLTDMWDGFLLGKRYLDPALIARFDLLCSAASGRSSFLRITGVGPARRCSTRILLLTPSTRRRRRSISATALSGISRHSLPTCVAKR